VAIRVGEAVPEALASAEVLDAAGGAHRLGEAWAGAPAVVVFLRHFGCIGCSEQVTELAPRLRELAELGVKTVLIGNGAADFITGFIERHALSDKPVSLFTDPSLNSFRAAGLLRSWWRAAGPRALIDIARALGRGHRGHAREGDTAQQGGALVVGGDGRVALHHVNRSLGDHAAAADLVDAALAIAAQKGAAWRI
jgi:peroxiredoxin